MTHEITPFGGEIPSNYNNRCLLVLVLDTSYSMSGEPINELNKGLKSFIQQLKTKAGTRDTVELSIITFDSQVECILEPALYDDIQINSSYDLKVRGSTKLVDGVRAAIKKAEDRKQWYKNNGLSYYRPWILLMTDGLPDPGQDIDGLAQEIQSGHRKQKFAFLPMGVEGADEATLRQISSPEFPPIPISWEKFSEMFDWLSSSMSRVSQSSDGDNVDFDPINTFTRSGWDGMKVTQNEI